MDIQKVALIGAGSVGAYVLWGTENIDMTVLAEGNCNQRCVCAPKSKNF